MAGKFGSASALLYVDGYDLLGSKIKNLSYKVEALNEDATGLGDSFKSKLPTGVQVLTITQAGAFFDTQTNGAHTALVTVASSPQGTQRVVTLGYGGIAVGDPFVGAQGVYAQSYEVLSKVNELTKANPQYAVSGQVDHGVLLKAMAAITGDTTGSTVDNTAASTNGGAGFLQVLAYSGLTSAAITIEHSTDGSSWATKGTFTTVTSGPTAERIALAGTINRYGRYVADLTGTGSITFLVGLARG